VCTAKLFFLQRFGHRCVLCVEAAVTRVHRTSVAVLSDEHTLLALCGTSLISSYPMSQGVPDREY
jgi:hypothetical protein